MGKTLFFIIPSMAGVLAKYSSVFLVDQKKLNSNFFSNLEKESVISLLLPETRSRKKMENENREKSPWVISENGKEIMGNWKKYICCCRISIKGKNTIGKNQISKVL